MVLAKNFKPYVCEKHDYVGSPSRCGGCRSEARKALLQGIPDTRKTVVLTADGRVCIKCEQGKPWSEFAKDVHGYNQKTANCLDCRNAKSRQVYKDNPNVKRGEIKNRPDRLMRLYGVTWEQVVQTLANQFGRCANHGCSKEISLDVKGVQKNRAVIDHCHTTGKFRAVLCVDCNCLLGQLETKGAKVLGLMDYINKHR